MKKGDTNFKFVIGSLSSNDLFTRLMTMEGNNITQNIYKTETKNPLLANAECLRELAYYANKMAFEYEDAVNIK